MSTSLHNPDRVEVVFDHPNLVSDSGLLLMATLAARLGLPGLIGRWVHTGVPNAAVKVIMPPKPTSNSSFVEAAVSPESAMSSLRFRYDE